MRDQGQAIVPCNNEVHPSLHRLTGRLGCWIDRKGQKEAASEELDLPVTDTPEGFLPCRIECAVLVI